MGLKKSFKKMFNGFLSEPTKTYDLIDLHSFKRDRSFHLVLRNFSLRLIVIASYKKQKKRPFEYRQKDVKCVLLLRDFCIPFLVESNYDTLKAREVESV